MASNMEEILRIYENNEKMVIFFVTNSIKNRH
jgi:hypothetical protein